MFSSTAATGQRYQPGTGPSGDGQARCRERKWAIQHDRPMNAASDAAVAVMQPARPGWAGRRRPKVVRTSRFQRRSGAVSALAGGETTQGAEKVDLAER